MKQFNFKNVIKEVGAINKIIYGIDPYEKKESFDPYLEHKEREERSQHLEELNHERSE